MRTVILLAALAAASVNQSFAVDLYGATPTAQSIALSGIYFGSLGPTDSLASNPAGLALSGRPALEVTGMGIFADGSFHNGAPVEGALNTKGAVSGSAAFSSGIPGTRLTLGAGIFPTALLSGSWKYMDMPGTAGVSYGMQNNKSAFLALQTSVGAGYQVNRWLSLGAGLGIVQNWNTLETPYIFQTNPTLSGLKALLNLHTNGTGENANFGALLTPARRLSIGVSYKTRTAIRTFGTANGNAGALFTALGLNVNSLYHYRAQVNNVFPQTASAAFDWKLRHSSDLYLQTDWLNWKSAFDTLPVYLTGGNNALLNTILKSTSLNDSVPLHWRNQVAVRAGFSVPLAESLRFHGGYAYTNDPVPSSTLTPLTAAITSNAVSTGLNYSKHRYMVQLGYQVNLPADGNVGKSQLLAGEYDNTHVRMWLQTVALTTGFHF